jgi:hypothetical protein
MSLVVVVAHIFPGNNSEALVYTFNVTASLEQCYGTSTAVYHKLNMKHKTITLPFSGLKDSAFAHGDEKPAPPGIISTFQRHKKKR